MVIFAAVGGRMSLVGAVYGTLLVNAGKTYFSESFPEAWLFLMAALFIGVTMAFPMGLAGVWEERIVPWWRKRREALKKASSTTVKAAPAAPRSTEGTGAGSADTGSATLPDGVRSQSV
jgi:urea transport system permease protein